jgi:putative endonuclease
MTSHDSSPSTAPGAARRPPVETGGHGETLACEHLHNLGLEVVARNWRISDGGLRGELDVVALDHANGLVVFVEVKTRRGSGFGGPLAAVDHRKAARVRRLAMAFMARAQLPYREVRFDVVGVRLDTRHLHHVMDAL